MFRDDKKRIYKIAAIGFVAVVAATWVLDLLTKLAFGAL